MNIRRTVAFVVALSLASGLFAGPARSEFVQLEQAWINGPEFTRSYLHHTAVVEELRPDAMVVLYQDAEPDGMVVQRDVWPHAMRKSGHFRFYRPWNGESPLPPVAPRRVEEPKIVREREKIDLLSMLDPELDSVRGVWWKNRKGVLCWNRDTPAALQLPYAPPEDYDLTIAAMRVTGVDQISVGLVVGGKQILLAIDSYGGDKIGLHLLDGKKANVNESTRERTVFTSHKVVTLKIQVRGNSIVAFADGKLIFDWTGDPSRFQLDERFSIPTENWLFLSSWNVYAHISEITLVER